MQVARPILDAGARAYAALLADPCNAPLAHPTYAGSEGAYVVRFETLNNYGIAVPTTTSGVLHWVPGAINPSSGYNQTCLYSESTSPGVATTMAAEATAFTPGATFLTTNASAYRCVAACMTVTWAGSELNRQGFVAVGNTQGSTITVGSSVAPGTVFALCSHSERMPERSLEIKWRPGSFDQTFSSISTPPTASEISRAGALSLFYDGTNAAGGGFIVKRTAVYEYIPSLALGVAAVPTSRNTSNNTLDQVINFLDSAGDWMTSAYRVGSRISNMAAYAAPGVRAVARATAPLMLGL